MAYSSDELLGTRAAREGERVPLVECAEDQGNNEKAIRTRVGQIPRGNGVNNSPEAARVGVHQEVDKEDYVIMSRSGNHVNIQSVLRRVFLPIGSSNMNYQMPLSSVYLL
jgi:hypothetical protein